MNIRIASVAVGVVALITGCSTPGDVRSTSPIIETTSSKPAKAVAGCIADKFELSFKTGVHSRPTSNGYSVWKEDDLGLYGKTTGLVVDVDDSPRGASIKFYSKGALASATDTVARAVEECKR